MSQIGEFIGVGEVYAAEVTADTTSTYTTGTQELIAPMGGVTIAPKSNTSTRYYGDKAYFTDTTEGETTLTFVLPNVPMATAAKLLGKHYDSTAKRIYDDGKANAPYMAVNFGVHAAEGAFIGYQFLKGKFAPWQEEAETIDDSGIKAKTLSLTYTAVCTEYAKWLVNGVASAMKLVKGDSRVDTTLTEAAWYTQVQKASTTT